jgi:putative endonuclease
MLCHSGARASARDPGIHNRLAKCTTSTLWREHKSKAVPGFTARYNVDRLVWFECYDDPINAIEREKELKKWPRNWKIRLIEETNPNRTDLYDNIAC